MSYDPYGLIQITNQVGYIPTFTSETGVTVTLGAAQPTYNQFFYSTLINGSNKLASFTFNYVLTLGAGTNPRYIDFSLPFSIDDKQLSPRFGLTNNGGTIQIGMVRYEAPTKTQFRLWCRYDLGSAFTAGTTNYVDFYGVIKID